MSGLKRLPERIVVDTGILLLPLTREKKWRIARELLRLGEEGSIELGIGLFNIAEMVSVMSRMGYEKTLAIEYASLVCDKLNVIRDTDYSLWMGILKHKSMKKKYNIPWGDLSSASAAISTKSPVLVLDNDEHFTHIKEIVEDLDENLEVLRIGDLEKTLSKAK